MKQILEALKNAAYFLEDMGEQKSFAEKTQYDDIPEKQNFLNQPLLEDSDKIYDDFQIYQKQINKLITFKEKNIFNDLTCRKTFLQLVEIAIQERDEKKLKYIKKEIYSHFLTDHLIENDMTDEKMQFKRALSDKQNTIKSLLGEPVQQQEPARTAPPKSMGSGYGTFN